ncbi:methylated-DNA--[protein]-cysteine S-methyltransferase [Latilactobacillus graminis]|nr:methylated-DNA--[protein]-cysteine S-methyltransferase [Latilactobacillus graminis]QFP80310.1 methylated-DNA--[protein]-cysteine S-methyltransferase [Latilactobacillus graminis]
MISISYGTLTVNQHQYILAVSQAGLCFVGSPDQTISELTTFLPDAQPNENQTVVAPFVTALQAYLTGKQTTWTLPIDTTNGTAFQQTVWQALQTIPYGQTTTYSALAAQIGRPTAVRAVASAVGRNPLLIVIPCHRVYRKDGKIGDYRGGLELKQALRLLEIQSK